MRKEKKKHLTRNEVREKEKPGSAKKKPKARTSTDEELVELRRLKAASQAEFNVCDLLAPNFAESEDGFTLTVPPAIVEILRCAGKSAVVDDIIERNAKRIYEDVSIVGFTEVFTTLGYDAAYEVEPEDVMNEIFDYACTLIEMFFGNSRAAREHYSKDALLFHCCYAGLPKMELTALCIMRSLAVQCRATFPAPHWIKEAKEIIDEMGPNKLLEQELEMYLRYELAMVFSEACNGAFKMKKCGGKCGNAEENGVKRRTDPPTKEEILDEMLRKLEGEDLPKGMGEVLNDDVMNIVKTFKQCLLARDCLLELDKFPQKTLVDGWKIGARHNLIGCLLINFAFLVKYQLAYRVDERVVGPELEEVRGILTATFQEVARLSLGVCMEAVDAVFNKLLLVLERVHVMMLQFAAPAKRIDALFGLIKEIKVLLCLPKTAVLERLQPKVNLEDKDMFLQPIEIKHGVRLYDVRPPDPFRSFAHCLENLEIYGEQLYDIFSTSNDEE